MATRLKNRNKLRTSCKAIIEKMIFEGKRFFNLYRHSNSKNKDSKEGTPLIEANIGFEQKVEDRIKELTEIIHQVRKSAQEQQKFSALVEKSVNFISIADLEGNIIYLNNGGMKLVGIDSKEEANKTKINDYFFEDELKFVKTNPYVANDYTDRFSGEFTLKHFKSGQPIPVFLNAFHIEDPISGQILALANVSNDLTDQKRKEEEMNSSREQLESHCTELTKKNEDLSKTNMDLDNFVYTASHDLKSPIANLEGLLLAIRKPLEQKLTEKEKQILTMMQNSIHKLNDTINALVEITKTQRSLKESKELVSISEVFDEVRLEIERLILESKAHITLDLAVENILYAKVNLHSIVYNLLSNAIKYRDPTRPLQIFVSTRRQDENVVLAIQDNGLGIPVTQLGELFGMFRRFHSHVEGTGIGLYIIKRVVENNKGRIEVDSDEGKGTCFKVYFTHNTF